MMKIPALILILAALVFVFSSCGKNTNEAPSSESIAADSSETDSKEWPLKIDAVTLDGDAVTEADFSGNTLTILNIWATWCPPCIEELPHLQEISELYKEQNVEIVGVMQDGVTKDGALDEEAIETGKKLIADSGVAYKMILPDETLTSVFINKMQYFPTTFFFDSEGNLVNVVVGAGTLDDWKGHIDGTLKEISK